MRSRASLVLASAGVVALLLLVFVAWQLFGGGRGELTAHSRSSFEPRGDEKLPEPASATDEMSGARAVPPAPSEPLVTATRESAPIVGKDEFVVEVVDARSRDPVAGARVCWLGRPRLAEIESMRGADISHVDDNELLEEFGSSAITGADGRAVIPRPKEYTSFAAARDRRWAYRPLVRPDDEDSVTLELTSDDSVCVQVVDRAGRPQPGFSVAFGAHGLDVGEQSRRARTREPDGVAVVKDLAKYVKLFSSRDPNWCVTLLVPCVDPPWAPFDPEHPPRAPLVLTLPEGGSIAVTFVGHDDQPVDAAIDLELAACPHVSVSAAGGPSSRTSSWISVFACRQRAEQGRLELPCVGLGLDLDFTGTIDGADLVNELVTGPTSAGEHLDVRILVSAGPVRFTGRLLDADGRPLPSTPVSLRIARNRMHVGGETDREGRFELTQALVGRLAETLDVELLVDLPDDVFALVKHDAAVARDQRSADLGDVTLPRQ